MTLENRKSAVLSLRRPWGISWIDSDLLPNEITCGGEKLSVLSFDYYESDILLSSHGEKWIGIVHFFEKKEEPRFLNWIETLDDGLVGILGINQVKMQSPFGENCINEDKGGVGYFSAIWEDVSFGCAIRTLTDKILWYGKIDEYGNILSVEALGIEDVVSLMEEAGRCLEMPGGLLAAERQTDRVVL